MEVAFSKLWCTAFLFSLIENKQELRPLLIALSSLLFVRFDENDA